MLALGLFIDQFAAVERNLAELVGATANLKDDMRRALLSGARIESSIDFIRRIYRAHGHSTPDHLERAFVQLNHINTARNLILHYGHARTFARLKPGQTVMSQDYRAVASDWSVSIGEPRIVPFSKDILEQMTEDADRIAYIARVQIETHLSHTPSRWKEMLARAQEPWRYIPPPPRKQSQPKRADKTQKQKPRPQS